MKIVLLILASATATVLVRGIVLDPKSCTAVGGGVGLCIPITHCPQLMALVTNEYGSEEDIRTLEKHKCSYYDEVPKVCCEHSCRTPDGLISQCVDISECDHLQKIAGAEHSIEDLTFIRHSRCNGQTQNIVCCGPDPEQFEDQDTLCEQKTFIIPPKSNTGCCGIDVNEDTIISTGEVADIYQHPWLAIIEHEMPDDSLKSVCGGSLISSRYVLSAAHCFVGKLSDIGIPINVRLGEFDTSKQERDCINSEQELHCNDPVVTIRIENITVHPSYNEATKENDIALIKMKKNAPYTRFIRPICLPEFDMTLRPAHVKTTAAGWGYINDTFIKSPLKLHVRLSIVNRQVCQKVYSMPIWKNRICVGGRQNVDICKGDSGGPLMYTVSAKQRTELIGIASITKEPCGVKQQPRLYTKVLSFKDWIYNNIDLN